MISKASGLCFAVFLLSATLFATHFPTVAAAALDGNSPALCANMEVQECVPDSGCKRVAAKEANLPRFIRIDFAGKEITRTRPDGQGLTSPIKRSEVVDGKLILQGAEDGSPEQRDGIGWSLSIDQTTGEMVLTGSGHEVGFVIFGACEPL